MAVLTEEAKELIASGARSEDEFWPGKYVLSPRTIIALRVIKNHNWQEAYAKADEMMAALTEAGYPDLSDFDRAKLIDDQPLPYEEESHDENR